MIFFLPLSVFGEKKTRDRRDQRLEWIFRAQGKHRGGGGKTEGRGASRNPHPGEVTDEDFGRSGRIDGCSQVTKSHEVEEEEKEEEKI